MTSKDKAIVRFHSLKSPQGQEQVCPWKLDVDLKHPLLHQSFSTLAGNSVWQLVVIRMRAHSQSQSKLADLLAQQMKPLAENPGSDSDVSIAHLRWVSCKSLHSGEQ